MFGISKPISVAMPKPEQSKATEELLAVLKEYNLFESETESRKREVVLGKLNSLVKEWVRGVCIKAGFNEQIAAEAGGKIFTFGSYRLGVHNSGADIDTLCVAPQHVERYRDFFGSMYEILKETPEVTELQPVPDAYVPVIKMVFSGIPIDLLFTQLQMPSIPENLDVSNINLLKSLDEQSVRSLNGTRLADKVLSLIPNVANFRLALRCIKLWAKKRGVYGNVMGYLGGVAWAMLVARICQLYPNACASTLVSRFFMIYDQWQWPNPILLTHIEDHGLGFKVWNPKVYPADSRHLMPVITPTYPSMNSTFNVSQSTLEAMKEEFHRGLLVTNAIESGTATWNDLFERTDFFVKFKNYIQVDASAPSGEDHRKWLGWVESRIRQLVLRFEMCDGVALVQPLPDSFHNTETVGDVERVTTSFFLGLVVETPRDAKDAQGLKKVDLTTATWAFIELVKAWANWKQGIMEIRVLHMKRKDIPLYVFEDGVRPRLKRKRQFVDEAPPAPVEEKPLPDLTATIDDQDKPETPTKDSTEPAKPEPSSPVDQLLPERQEDDPLSPPPPKKIGIHLKS